MLVAASLNNYQLLQSAVGSEAASVVGIDVYLMDLNLRNKKQIFKICLDYCEYVINEEYPELEKGRYSDKTFSIYAKLLKTIVTVRPSFKSSF